MYKAMLHAHSGLRWVVLIFLLLAIFRHATAGNKPYHLKNGLLLMIVSDIMLLIGLYLFFASPNWGWVSFQNRSFSEVMKDPYARFFALEHQVGMIIAIAFIHIGKAQGKKSLPDAQKHRRAFIFYLIALLVILISIPWPFRMIGTGRGWF